MIFILLLLLCLISSVCGTFVVNVTQTFYQAEENQNITLEWTFTTKPDRSLDLARLYIFCKLITELRPSVLFHLHEGVEVSESQHEHFAGRVQCDEDVLREGRLRLHVSRLRTEDSGRYLCEVLADNESDFGKFHLNVTAARARPEPETPNTTSHPQPESPGRIGLYCGLTAATVVLLAVGLYLFRHFRNRSQVVSSFYRRRKLEPTLQKNVRSVETPNSARESLVTVQTMN